MHERWNWSCIENNKHAGGFAPCQSSSSCPGNIKNRYWHRRAEEAAILMLWCSFGSFINKNAKSTYQFCVLGDGDGLQTKEMEIRVNGQKDEEQVLEATFFLFISSKSAASILARRTEKRTSRYKQELDKSTHEDMSSTYTRNAMLLFAPSSKQTSSRVYRPWPWDGVEGVGHFAWKCAGTNAHPLQSSLFWFLLVLLFHRYRTHACSCWSNGANANRLSLPWSSAREADQTSPSFATSLPPANTMSRCTNLFIAMSKNRFASHA